MASEPTERKVMIWGMVGVIFAMLVQAAILAISYGRLQQKVDDIDQQVQHIQQYIDAQYQNEQNYRAQSHHR
jgi:cell division protein FtsL